MPTEITAPLTHDEAAALSGNLKSDVNAKAAFASALLAHNYQNVRVARTPADVIGEQRGETHYFEIKFTRKTDVYFGAATLTEWSAAAEHPDRFWFVIAHIVNDEWRFVLYDPEEFLEFSYVPPFKVYFSIPLWVEQRVNRVGSKSRRLRVTKSIVLQLAELYKRLREP